MSLHRYEETEVNLNQYPRLIHDPTGKQIALGDIHGDARKLIHHLIEEGILEISRKDYASIIRIYNKKTALTTTDLARFNRIIDQATINKKPDKLYLLGDLLADRGKNDYLTLKVLEKLGTSKINYEILFSNHDAQFLSHWQCFLSKYDKNTEKFPTLRSLTSTYGSANSFFKMLEDFFSRDDYGNPSLSFESILQNTKDILSEHYFPKLTLLNGFVLPDKKPGGKEEYTYAHMTHAPTEFATAFNTLKTHYKLDAKQPKKLPELVGQINTLNQKFRNDLTTNSFWKEYEKQDKKWAEHEKAEKNYTKIAFPEQAPQSLDPGTLYLVHDTKAKTITIQATNIKPRHVIETKQSEIYSELLGVLNTASAEDRENCTSEDGGFIAEIKETLSKYGLIHNSGSGDFIKPEETPLIYPIWSRMKPNSSQMNPLDDQNLNVIKIFGHTGRGLSITEDKKFQNSMINLDNALGGPSKNAVGTYRVARASGALTLNDYLEKAQSKTDQSSSTETKDRKDESEVISPAKTRKITCLDYVGLGETWRFFRGKYPKTSKTLTYAGYSGLTLSLSLALTAGLGWLKHGGDFHYYLDLPMPYMNYFDVKQGTSAVALALLLLVVMGYLLHQCTQFEENDNPQHDPLTEKKLWESTPILPFTAEPIKSREVSVEKASATELESETPLLASLG